MVLSVQFHVERIRKQTKFWLWGKIDPQEIKHIQCVPKNALLCVDFRYPASSLHIFLRAIWPRNHCHWQWFYPYDLDTNDMWFKNTALTATQLMPHFIFCSRKWLFAIKSYKWQVVMGFLSCKLFLLQRLNELTYVYDLYCRHIDYRTFSFRIIRDLFLKISYSASLRCSVQ